MADPSDQTWDAEDVLKVLADMLCFDRPVAKARMVDEARDFLLEVGWPVGNDTRSAPRNRSGWALLWPHRRRATSGDSAPR